LLIEEWEQRNKIPTVTVKKKMTTSTLFDDEGHPILPALGNMPLEKAKQTMRSYWTGTYHNFFVFVFQSMRLAADILWY